MARQSEIASFRNVDKDLWIGLDNLTEIDLGWNEIKQLSYDAFLPLSDNLLTLNLRHNPLKTVGAFGA